MDSIKSHQQLSKLPTKDLLSVIQKNLLNICDQSVSVTGITKEQGIESYLRQISKSTARETFSLILSEKIEGCYPLLKQIWKISLTPDCKHFSHPGNFPSQMLIIQSYLKSEHIYIEANSGPTLVPTWDNRLSYSSIHVHPTTPFSIGHNGKCLTIQIEYQVSDLKPRIFEQNLGSRPRLVSFDSGEDLKDFQLKTEKSPGRKSLSKQLSLINSESFYEENEIGFSLIHSTLADYQDSEDELQVGQDIFDLDLKTFQPQAEDSQIPLYIQNCGKMSQLKLFSSFQNPSELVKNWGKTE